MYDEDKPDYKTFLSILCHPSYTDTFLWSALCDHGIYYSRKELITVGTEKDISKRVLGVLFTKSGWYAVYNTLNSFSHWMSKLEEDGVIALASQISPALAYRNAPPRSIVFVVGRGMVAAMVSGHRYGHDRTGKIPKEKRKDVSKSIMTLENMAVPYDAVYLIELNSGGVSSLAWLITKDERRASTERQALVDGNPGVFKLASMGNGQSAVVDVATGRETIIIQAYDLTMLRRIRKGTQAVNVIGPPWMADTTSKSLGPKLGTYTSLYGDGEVQVNRYNEYGDKLSLQTS